MNDEEKAYWARFWSMAFGVVALVVLSVTTYNVWTLQVPGEVCLDACRGAGVNSYDATSCRCRR